MTSEEFRRHGYQLIDWIADYLNDPERYPVLARVKPGDIRAALPAHPPESPEPFADILSDFERVLVPGLTHWNHPGFFAYFAISSSPPGILAELLSAALNQQAMLWRTSPAATELEEVALGWLRELMGLPETFEGVIYDTASVSTLHALAAAREAHVPGVRTHGLASGGGSRPRVYCSDQTHSSIDKAVILLGLGHEALRKIPSDGEFRMRPDALAAAVAEDRRDGWQPIAVVATVGSTSTTSIDPVPAIADICERERLWLHVDAAYAGVAAIVPEYRHVLEGASRADSLVVNPHKWLFTPFDLSALYTRHMNMLRRAFSIVPEFILQTGDTAEAKNLMDTGIQLGRRFRALKLWMILRHFGAEGLRHHLREHMRLARLFAAWVDADAEMERLAPVPFSVVCFRLRPSGRIWSESDLDALNQRAMNAVNGSGEVFLSHTKIGTRYAIRLAVGHLATRERHVRRAFELVREQLSSLKSEH